MSKVLKIVGQSTGILFECLLAFLVIFLFVVRSSFVQTYIANQVTQYLSSELKTTVKIDNVDVIFFDRLAIDGLLIKDQTKDTLISMNTLKVKWNTLDVIKQKINLESISLNDGFVNITKKDGIFNFDFILDYFKSDDVKKEPSKFDFSLSDLKLNNIKFYYNDSNKAKELNKLDFYHLLFDDISANIKNIKINTDQFSCSLQNFTATDQSGFEIKKVKSDFFLSERGIQLKNTYINTKDSKIVFSKANFNVNDLSELSDFENQVKLDVQLGSSQVSFNDLSYFVPDLKGMNELVILEGLVKNTVNQMNLDDFSISIGKKTSLKGSFKLPELKNITKSNITQDIDYLFLDFDDLAKIKLPINSSSEFLKFDPKITQLDYVELIDTKLKGGLNNFNISVDTINTMLGSLSVNELGFKWDSIAEAYLFTNNPFNHSIELKSFRLGKLLNKRSLNLVSGKIGLNAFIPLSGDFSLSNINGNINQFDFNNYSYSNINISDGTFFNSELKCKIDINDENLILSYNGSFDFKGIGHYQCEATLNKATQDILQSKFAFIDSSHIFKSTIKLDLYGNDVNNLKGNISLVNSKLAEFEIPEFNFDVFRSKEKDVFDLSCSLFDFRLEGKIDLHNIVTEFSDKLTSIVPRTKKTTKTKLSLNNKNDFKYNLSVRNANSFLLHFKEYFPELIIASGSRIYGNYNSIESDFKINAESDLIRFNRILFSNIDINQSIKKGEIDASCNINSVTIRDSIQLNNVLFHSEGMNNHLISNITWDPNSKYQSDVSWVTDIVSNEFISLTILPSSFSIDKKKWIIADSSNILMANGSYKVSGFEMNRSEQLIRINGSISGDTKDGLNLGLSNIDLSEIDHMFGINSGMKGSLNGSAFLSDPKGVIRFTSNLFIDSLYINNHEIGNITTLAAWDPILNCVSMDGDLFYLDQKTFDFSGKYFIKKKKNNLDFNLDFNKMPIGIANAFMNEDVVNNINGKINGKLKVTGEPIAPVMKGRLFVDDASANISILGVDLNFNGKLKVLPDAFIIDNMPVKDEDGNVGNLIATIYHNDFSDWNYDVILDLETNPITHSKTNKFLVLNTDYKEGDYYYGKAYANGSCEIEGDESEITISVDLKTEKGTKINFPMYGTSDIDAENEFITFVSREKSETIEPKIDLSSVNLDLNFEITPDAEIKLTFNEQTGDEIVAYGEGNLNMKMNDVHELNLEGVLNINEGSRYDFAMGQIKQKFDIQKGSNIVWSGNPYDADINLVTSFSFKSDYGDLAPEIEDKSLSNKNVTCFLNLSESLLKPKIEFDIESGNELSELGKALLNRVKGDPNELSLQFFSLLIFRTFQPLQESPSASGSAAIDLVESQINSILGQVSKDYKLSLNIESGDFNSQNQNSIENQNQYSVMEFDVSKSFLENRLIVSGSFGVKTDQSTSNNGTTSSETTSTSSLIGDVMIEYLINQKGNLRINAFNESNRNKINQSDGDFTQGAGVSYQEEFDNWQDFKLFQTFLDIFRPKRNKKIKIKRKKRQKKVPILNENGYNPANRPNLMSYKL